MKWLVMLGVIVVVFVVFGRYDGVIVLTLMLVAAIYAGVTSDKDNLHNMTLQDQIDRKEELQKRIKQIDMYIEREKQREITS